MNSTDHVRKDIGVGELEGSEDEAMAWEPSDPGLSHWDCVSGYRPDLLDATYNLAPMGIVWSSATDVVQYAGDRAGTHCQQKLEGVSNLLIMFCRQCILAQPHCRKLVQMSSMRKCL